MYYDEANHIFAEQARISMQQTFHSILKHRLENSKFIYKWTSNIRFGQFQPPLKNKVELDVRMQKSPGRRRT